jgi:hypothetical protein
MKSLLVTKMEQTGFRLLFLLLSLSLAASAQTVAPFMGLGNAQFFDNNGKPLTAGVLYSYQAGTSTQQATFTDSTGTTLNPNPIPFGSGARVQIWLTAGAFYKFVLCLQNDGPFCAPADVLFSVDQVPGSPGGSSGSSSSPFTSNSASPATTGILRLASGDAICWRNAAGTANLCIRKDASDVLSWDGGAMKFPEIPCANAGLGFDYLCASSTNHRWMMANNGGGQVQMVGAGQDINTSDFVTQLHFGATGTPLSATPPSTSQVLLWDGTHIVGATQLVTVAAGTATLGTSSMVALSCGNAATITTTSGNVSNVLVTDRIIWSFQTAAVTPPSGAGGWVLWPFIATPGGNVNFWWCSTFTASSDTPPAVTVNWSVVR